MVTRKMCLMILGCMTVWENCQLSALTVLDPALHAETYVSYDFELGNRPAGDMAFDPQGNLYIVQYENYDSYDGRIYRVDTNKNISTLATGLTRPEDIIWCGGTSFGEYLYVTEGFDNAYNNDGGVTRIGLDGSINRFVTSGFNQPSSLGVDRVGNYGGNIYVGSGDSDRINKVLPDGQVQGFYSFGGNPSGSPVDIEFAPNGSYGGLMYVATQFSSLTDLSGILTFDAAGNPTKIAPEIVGAFDLAFDTTNDQLFGGYLYASGRLASDPDWMSRIFRIYPDGTPEEIMTASSWRSRMTFGEDGLYLNESGWDNSIVIISRVTPEPTSMMLLGLGLLGLHRRRKK